MKVCIVTFQSAYNYGAVLQAYALQEYVNCNFAEAVILDYHNKNIDDSYRVPTINDFISKPKNVIFKSMQTILYKGKRQKIDKFRNKYLSLTKYYDKANITDANDEADVFITGSDQVWNYLITGKDSTYYLDFASNKPKCSYAASFGVADIPGEFEQFYKKNIKKIDWISVREEVGVSLAQKFASKDISMLPDPTLLVDKQKWESIMLKPEIGKKYILVYKITKADQLLVFARKISKMTGLPILFVPNDIKDGLVGELRTNVGPREWLGLIHGAEYVITNSFHGTVFSILFAKKFFAEISEKVNPSTSRLQSLLKLFNMENRTVNRFTEDMLEQEIDMAMVETVLQREREKTYLFFRRIFTYMDNGKDEVKD